MPKLTPEQWAAQWVNAPHRFQINVHNFEVKAGKAAVDVFQGSFDRKRLNTANSKSWPKWQGQYSGGGTLLDEFGYLRKSIKVKSVMDHKVVIHTDPSEFSGHTRNSGFCFAEVHNNLDSIGNKPKRGPKRERQFICVSTVLEAELKKLSVHIFDGFPRSK